MAIREKLKMSSHIYSWCMRKIYCITGGIILRWEQTTSGKGPNRMNFRQLEAFRHVILTGTTKEAASRMFVSQPAISRLIKALEEELGFTLFKRLKVKKSTNGSPDGSFHQPFFRCNISLKSAMFPVSGQTAPNVSEFLQRIGNTTVFAVIF